MAVNLTMNCRLDLTEAEIPILLILTLIFNSISLAVIVRMKCLTESIDHVLVTTLTVNDFISTVLFILMWVAGWITCGQILQNISCDILGWLATTTTMWSAGVVTVMSGCRYLALVRPLYYRIHVNVKGVKVALAVFLIVLAILTVFPLFGLEARYLYYESNFICAYNFTPGDGDVFHRSILGVMSVFGLLLTVIVLFFNISILGQERLDYLRNSKIQKFSNTSQVGHADSIKRPSVLHSKRITITTITGVVSLIFCSTYGPFLVRVLIDVVKNTGHQNDLYHSVTFALLFLSPLLNPIIYVFFNSRNRKCLVQLIKCCFHRATCSKRLEDKSNSETAESQIQG